MVAPPGTVCSVDAAMATTTTPNEDAPVSSLSLWLTDKAGSFTYTPFTAIDAAKREMLAVALAAVSNKCKVMADVTLPAGSATTGQCNSLTILVSAPIVIVTPPPPKNLLAAITPAPLYGQPIDYTVEVIDTATSAVVPGATVKIITPAPTEKDLRNSETVTKTTGANGSASFAQLTLLSVSLPVVTGKGVVQVTTYPQLFASAAGFNSYSTQLNEAPA
jgi:hypothetical protein